MEKESIAIDWAQLYILGIFIMGNIKDKEFYIIKIYFLFLNQKIHRLKYNMKASFTKISNLDKGSYMIGIVKLNLKEILFIMNMKSLYNYELLQSKGI